MAGQGPDRRETLRILSIASVAAGFPGFSRWCFAQQPPHAITAPAYKPLFFSPGEYSLLELLTEIVIPTDETPGAKEAGVSEFIDFMAFNDPEIQGSFRHGLAWFASRNFAALNSAARQAQLESLAYKNRYRDGEEDGRKFFQLLREYTLMGYYTTRIGLEQLDFPGFRLYSESPACPHPGRHA